MKYARIAGFMPKLIVCDLKISFEIMLVLLWSEACDELSIRRIKMFNEKINKSEYVISMWERDWTYIYI